MGGWERANKYHHYYNLKKINFRKSNEELSKIFNDLRKDCLNKYFGIDKKKIIFTPHYLCHHYHAYYSARSNFNNNQIIMHIEGDGGKYNCGVSKATTNGIKFLGGSNQGDIGRLYQWTTLNLGMKPYHHEYKVMGLAPYATDSEVQKTFKIFKNLFKVSNDSNAIVYNPRFKPKDLYFTINRLIQGHRFDGVAGALQKCTETIILDWFKSNIHKHKPKEIFYGGGVAMNVKANGLISKDLNFHNLMVPLAPSDESNAIGAAYMATEKLFLADGVKLEQIKPLNNYYLGKETNIENLIKSIQKKKINNNENFIIKENINNKYLAKKLFDSKIIGRFSGRAEFGQRALGNRSILADPTKYEIIEKINSQIKYRDFWMPFCPTIL